MKYHMENEKVFETLRDSILNLSLKPGQSLDLNALEEQFKVSRSPIRDAINKLALANLVTILPQRGTKVSQINLQLADDERFIRLNLELGTLDGFLKNVTDEDFKEMEAIIDKQRVAFAARDTATFMTLDSQFHKKFFTVAKRENVFHFINNNNGNYHRLRMISFYFDNLVSGVIDEHVNLLEVAKTNNYEALRDLDHKHISKLIKETISFREAMPAYFC
ncbi:MAG: GntR family transcriptional regulator [Sphaerochaetaceae bacterium]|nr:GntR family transcriptional regulator [Sphaerochaetaceae bacterium]